MCYKHVKPITSRIGRDTTEKSKLSCEIAIGVTVIGVTSTPMAKNYYAIGCLKIPF